MILDKHGTGTHASTRVFLLRSDCRRSFLIFKRRARICRSAPQKAAWHSRDSRVALCFILAGPKRAGYGSLLFAETVAKGADRPRRGPEHALLQSVGPHAFGTDFARSQNTAGVFSMDWMALNTDKIFRADQHCVSRFASRFGQAPSLHHGPRSSILPETAPEKIGRTKTPGLGGTMGIPFGAWATGTLRDKLPQIHPPPPPGLVSALGRTPAARSSHTP